MDGDGPRGWGAPLYAAVLDATGVGPGTTVLDLGCGTGSFARAAADRGARVTGVDADPAAVVLAIADVPEGTFAVGDALEPPSGPFDVVAAVQLLTHVEDPVGVLAAARGVGAVVAATVWGRPEECDVAILGEALAPLLGEGAVAPAQPLAEPAELGRLAVRAGLRVERLEEVVCPFSYADEDDLLEPLLLSGLGRAAARRAGPTAVRAAVLDRLAPYRTEAGGYLLHNLFRLVVTRPA